MSRTVELPFKVPHGYRREFHLFIRSSRYRLLVYSNRTEYCCMGEDGAGNLSASLDWLEDCIVQVRRELGK